MMNGKLVIAMIVIMPFFIWFSYYRFNQCLNDGYNITQCLNMMQQQQAITVIGDR